MAVTPPFAGSRRAPAPAAALALLAALAAAPSAADISGFVRLAGSGTPGTPIAGAQVQLRADPSITATTAADGSFTLPVNPAGFVDVAASVDYDRNAATNYTMGGATASNGATGVDIRLEVLPAAANTSYVPPTASACGDCHAPIQPAWETSAHAGAARNEWVLDVYSGTGTPGGAAGYVFRPTHPGETGFCATCHTPMVDVFQPGQTYLDEVTAPEGLDGVNCVSCHQMDSVNAGNINALHLLGKSTYRFPLDPLASTADYVWGPLADVTTGLMRASRSSLHKSSLLCASCHQYTNPENGAPGQNTYVEWQGSHFAQPGPGYRTCQDCHMPRSQGLGTICVYSPADRPGDQRRQHTFFGSTPAALQARLGLTMTAQEVAPGRIRVDAAVDNFGAGHSFPTGVSIRNALLVVEATYSGGAVPQASGPTIPYWGSDDVPGNQPGDYAGYPGKGFAKVLQGRINGTGPVVQPVLFIDAESAASDTTIPSGAVDTTRVEFQLPPGLPAGTQVAVSARLLYRRTFRALQVTKGWTQSAHGGPIEIEVAARQAQVVSGGSGNGGAVAEIPTVSAWGLAALAAAILGAGLALSRRVV